MLFQERIPVRRALTLFKKEILGRTCPGSKEIFSRDIKAAKKERDEVHQPYCDRSALPQVRSFVNCGVASIDGLLEVNSYIDLAAGRTAGGGCVEEITSTESGPEGTKPHRAKA